MSEVNNPWSRELFFFIIIILDIRRVSDFGVHNNNISASGTPRPPLLIHFQFRFFQT